MKDPVTTKVANRILTPLARYAAANRGVMKEIHARLCKRTKKQWHRENVERWLHADEDKRTHPLLGVGLLLTEIGEDVREDFEAAKAAEKGKA